MGSFVYSVIGFALLINVFAQVKLASAGMIVGLSRFWETKTESM
jgi:hypothetical protein